MIEMGVFLAIMREMAVWRRSWNRHCTGSTFSIESGLGCDRRRYTVSRTECNSGIEPHLNDTICGRG